MGVDWGSYDGCGWASFFADERLRLRRIVREYKIVERFFSAKHLTEEKPVTPFYSLFTIFSVFSAWIQSSRAASWPCCTMVTLDTMNASVLYSAKGCANLFIAFLI